MVSSSLTNWWASQTRSAGFLADAAFDQRTQCFGDKVQRRRSAGVFGFQYLERRPAKGFLAGDAFDEDAGGCVEVGGGGGGFAGPLFGCHVGGPAWPPCPVEEGDAEVDQFRCPSSSDEDVGGFVVAVHDPDRACAAARPSSDPFNTAVRASGDRGRRARPGPCAASVAATASKMIAADPTAIPAVEQACHVPGWTLARASAPRSGTCFTRPCVTAAVPGQDLIATGPPPDPCRARTTSPCAPDPSSASSTKPGSRCSRAFTGRCWSGSRPRRAASAVTCSSGCRDHRLRSRI